MTTDTAILLVIADLRQTIAQQQDHIAALTAQLEGASTQDAPRQ